MHLYCTTVFMLELALQLNGKKSNLKIIEFQNAFTTFVLTDIQLHNIFLAMLGKAENWSSVFTTASFPHRSSSNSKTYSRLDWHYRSWVFEIEFYEKGLGGPEWPAFNDGLSSLFFLFSFQAFGFFQHVFVISFQLTFYFFHIFVRRQCFWFHTPFVKNFSYSLVVVYMFF